MTTTVDMPPEKLCGVGEKTGSVVLYTVDTGNLQHAAVVQDGRWRTKRAAIYALVFVLTTLILTAGSLGAITIVMMHRTSSNGDIDMEQPRAPQRGTNSPAVPPDSHPGIETKDEGLLPLEPATPDRVVADDGIDSGIHFAENSTERGPDHNEILIDGKDELPTEPILKRPPNLESSESDPVWVPSSEDQWQSADYGTGGTNVSSSFPYVGVQAWGEKSGGDSHADTDTEASGLPSGDSEFHDDDDDIEEISGSGDKEAASKLQPASSVSSDHTYLDSSFPYNTFSDMYYDSTYK